MKRPNLVARTLAPARYGVIEQTVSENEVDYAVESLQHLGYAVISGGYEPSWVESLSQAFDRATQKNAATHGGLQELAAINENNTVRLPLIFENILLDLARNENVLKICRRLIADYIVLNQQNGVINPPRDQPYEQGVWHRDLPYQHFVSLRPLAISALFCVDTFLGENGATKVLPGSHRLDAFPSDRFVREEAVTIEAPAGSFIMLDSMVFHTGGLNTTNRARRAVNHVYSIPLMRQQIDLPAALGEQFETDPSARRLLGYDVPTPRSVAEYLATRKKRGQPR